MIIELMCSGKKQKTGELNAILFIVPFYMLPAALMHDFCSAIELDHFIVFLI
jgi:hypothetical protein